MTAAEDAQRLALAAMEAAQQRIAEADREMHLSQSARQLGPDAFIALMQRRAEEIQSRLKSEYDAMIEAAQQEVGDEQSESDSPAGGRDERTAADAGEARRSDADQPPTV